MRPEDALQQQVCSYLAAALPLASWWSSIPNGAVLAGDRAQRARQWGKLARTGARKGAPDLIVLHDGRLLAIELKAGRGKTSPEQDANQRDIETAGGAYTVARSVDEVEAYLLAYGVPLRTRLMPMGHRSDDWQSFGDVAARVVESAMPP